LYAGGGFTIAGRVVALAKWDGTQWSALNNGMGGIPFDRLPSVFALTVFDDGSGPALYAGGLFTSAGGEPTTTTNFIAKWNGANWSAVGSGIGGTSVLPSVYALTVFNDGSGPALYAGGTFTSAGGVPINRVAKWDGTSWSAVGITINSGVYAL